MAVPRRLQDALRRPQERHKKVSGSPISEVRQTSRRELLSSSQSACHAPARQSVFSLTSEYVHTRTNPPRPRALFNQPDFMESEPKISFTKWTLENGSLVFLVVLCDVAGRAALVAVNEPSLLHPHPCLFLFRSVGEASNKPRRLNIQCLQERMDP